MGKAATFTARDAKVKPNAGVVRYIPRDPPISFLANAVTAAVYLSEWCFLFCDSTIHQCFDMITDLSSVHPNVEREIP